jgi:hypothetical protein
LRILDFNGERAFNLFRFDEMGPATLYESPLDGTTPRGAAIEGRLTT